MVIVFPVCVMFKACKLDSHKPDPLDELKGRLRRDFIRETGVEETEVLEGQPAGAHNVPFIGKAETAGVSASVFQYERIILKNL